MFGDDKDYKFFVTILVLAIVISIIFHIFFTPDTDAFFSEVYFPEPDALPNDVYLGETYNFDFAVRNLEGKPSTYKYDSKVELYNLYDVTEGTYNCIAKQRRKVGLRWIENNYTTTGTFLLNNLGIEGTNFVFSEADDYGEVNWPYYTLRYKFKNILGKGTFSTVFHEGKEVKYYITIFDESAEVELAYKNGSILQKERTKIKNLSRENDIVINVTDSLKYYFNGDLLFDKPVTLTDGKIAFVMNNSYITISNMVAYQDSKDESNPKFIREYSIDKLPAVKKHERLVKRMEENVELLRREANFAVKCQEDECLKLKNYINSPKNIYSFHSNYSFDEITLLSLIDTKLYDVKSYSYLQNMSTNNVWSNFSVKVNFELLNPSHAILFNLNKDLMILFHNFETYVIVRHPNGTSIQRQSNLIDIGANNLRFEAISNTINMLINSDTVFTLDKSINLRNVSIYTKNTMAGLGNLAASNMEEGCGLILKSTSCKRNYLVQSVINISKEKIEALADPIEVAAGLAAIPILGISDIFEFEEVRVQEFIEQPEEVERSSIMDLLEYDIEVDPSLVDEDIPSETYVFDGENATVKSQKNYSFGFDFSLLEGVGLIEVAFHDINRSKISSFILNIPHNQSNLFTNFEGKLNKEAKNVNISKEFSTNFKINYGGKKATYFLNQNAIFETEGIDMSNGFFSVSTFNTHFDIGDMAIKDLDTGKSVSLSINADPCRLRKIGEVQIKKSPLYLADKEKEVTKQNFFINEDFDYGKVSVTLKHQEKLNETEIHFWVVKND